MLSFSYFLTKKARKIRMKQGNSKLIASSKELFAPNLESSKHMSIALVRTSTPRWGGFILLKDRSLGFGSNPSD